MGKKQKNLGYGEGSWFSVPLLEGGYSLGVVARLDGAGSVFGYFFGPQRACKPESSDIQGLGSADAIYSCQFGDLGLIEGTWPLVVDGCTNWDRDRWPLPAFVRVDRISGKALKVIYSDELELVSEEPCAPNLAEVCPQDGLAGYRFVEIALTKRLGPPAAIPGSGEI